MLNLNVLKVAIEKQTQQTHLKYKGAGRFEVKEC